MTLFPFRIPINLCYFVCVYLGEMISRISVQSDTNEVMIGSLALMDTDEDRKGIKADAFSVSIYVEKMVGGNVVDTRWGSVNCYFRQEDVIPNRLFTGGADAVRLLFCHSGASDFYVNREYKGWGTLIYYDPPAFG